VVRGTEKNRTPGRLCPYCSQQLPEYRHGVRLTPGKVRLYDLIACAGESGIATVDLVEITGLKAQCIKSHVWQINDALEESGYRIRGYGWGGNGQRDGLYRLVNGRGVRRRRKSSSRSARSVVASQGPNTSSR